MGDAGGFLRYSSGRSGASSHPAVLGWGVVDGLITVYHWNQETGGGRGYPGWSCCPEPGSESRFRIPVQNPAGARGSGLVGEISWLPDHPGGPQVFSLELSARKSRRPEPQ